MYTKEQLEGMIDYELDVQVHILNNGLENRDPTPNYCNNWADMGPLINDLSKLGTIVIADGFGLIPKPLSLMICSAGKTLRAAAIVYILVMQEKES